MEVYKGCLEVFGAQKCIERTVSQFCTATALVPSQYKAILRFVFVFLASPCFTLTMEALWMLNGFSTSMHNFLTVFDSAIAQEDEKQYKILTNQASRHQYHAGYDTDHPSGLANAPEVSIYKDIHSRYSGRLAQITHQCGRSAEYHVV